MPEHIHFNYKCFEVFVSTNNKDCQYQLGRFHTQWADINGKCTCIYFSLSTITNKPLLLEIFTSHDVCLFLLLFCKHVNHCSSGRSTKVEDWTFVSVFTKFDTLMSWKEWLCLSKLAKYHTMYFVWKIFRDPGVRNVLILVNFFVVIIFPIHLTALCRVTYRDHFVQCLSGCHTTTLFGGHTLAVVTLPHFLVVTL